MSVYYSDIGIIRNWIPQGVFMDLFEQSTARYGKINLPATHRKVQWTQIEPGKWQVEVAPLDAY